jgi:hypothetical protein
MGRGYHRAGDEDVELKGSFPAIFKEFSEFFSMISYRYPRPAPANYLTPKLEVHGNNRRAAEW